MKKKCICTAICVPLFAVSGTAGSAEFPAMIDLTQLDGTDGFVIAGIQANGDLGATVSALGDLNGDGIGDFGVSGFRYDVADRPNTGVTFVFFGASGIGSSGDLSLRLDGSNGFRVVGAESFDVSGVSMSAMFDVNADGLDDLAIGSTGVDLPDAGGVGEVAVLFSGPELFGSGNFRLSTVDGNNGFRMNGIEPGELFGERISRRTGDINGDGIQDMAAIAPSAEPDGLVSQGRVYVIFGGGDFGASATFDLSQLDGTNGFAIIGEAERQGLDKIEIVPDINGDGFDDVLVGAQGHDVGEVNNVGRAYLIFGGAAVAPGGLLDLQEFAEAPVGRGFTLTGTGETTNLGEALSGLGDFNADGFNDIAIAEGGNRDFGEFSGVVFIVFGSPDVGESGEIDPRDLYEPSAVGTAVIGEADPPSLLGTVLGGAGDFNGDGYPDLPIFQLDTDVDGQPFPGGAARIVFGGPGFGEAGPLFVSMLDGSNGFTVFSSEERGDCGIGQDSAGDVNADGVDDLVIGCPEARPDDIPAAGTAYVVFGRNTVSDVDGDGIVDTSDNCIDVANADQRDTNDDGFGNVCDADLNNDCLVTGQDWLIMRDVLFTDDADADLDGNGIVNGGDALALFEARFTAPGPSGVDNACGAG